MFGRLKKIGNQKGFTLIEMLIAMTIFVTFTTVLMGSYTSIVSSQGNANDFRVMYSEARRSFDTLTRELRDAMVDYGYYGDGGLTGPQDDIHLITKDGRNKLIVSYEAPTEDGGNGTIVLEKGRLPLGVNPRTAQPIYKRVELNSVEVNVTDFAIYVSPSIDPYDQKFVSNDINQFHPKITIFAGFERELRNGDIVSMDLQTSVSSRVYNQVYPTN